MHEQRLYESETFTPVWIQGDKALVISDYDVGRQALWRFDITKGEFEELVYAADGFDIDEPIFSQEGSDVIGVSYYGDYRIDKYFDDAQESKAAFVKGSFPQYETVIESRSLDGNRLIVQASRDDSPSKYFWLDVQKKTGGVWFSQFPYLEQATLSSVQPFELETPDGMVLNGYLTMPAVATDSKPPLIVHPHGGPQSRDYRYFSPYVQFFASRGYAVLQINFRGSTGFGNEYEVAGYREWGMAMQDDVYQAIDWLAAQDVVDMKRACVVGGSYGGYVALTAAYQKPEAFRCHVALAAVSDLREQALAAFRWDFYKPFVKRTIGDPTDSDDKRMLDLNSPINHLSKITRPVLLIHGTHDTQVRVQQSRKFHSEAKRAKRNVEYMEIEFGTHYFDEYNSRLEVFKAMEEFLRKHL
jgi:dipeptidyl aminopeptidase/acylaminoacyl peptidase